MNYRHAFHAGNFADVLKHAIVARILVHLGEKEQPYRVIDTHAGAGLYDLSGEEAARTGEWQKGIGRLLAGRRGPDLDALLAPYLSVVARVNCDPAETSGQLEAPGASDDATEVVRAGARISAPAAGPDGLGPASLRAYPGSPLLALGLMRPQDRLVACELEAGAAAALAGHLKRDRRAKAVAIDGWIALNAFVPPKERRGLVIIDPPFEAKDDFARLAERAAQAWRKWPTGVYALWYPIKDRAGPDALAHALAAGGIAKILRVELTCGSGGEEGQLRASGLIIVNPPWRLAQELGRMVPGLAGVLSDAPRADWRLDWLAGEK